MAFALFVSGLPASVLQRVGPGGRGFESRRAPRRYSPGRTTAPSARRTLRRMRPTRTDVLLAACCAIALALIGATAPKAGGLDGVGTAAILLAAAPVLLRTARPTVSVLACVPGIFAVLEVSTAYEVVALPIALCAYAAASTRGTAVAIPLGVALTGVVLVAVAIYSPHGIIDVETLKNTALVAIPLVAGCAVRDRRAYLAALVARAETAERTREEEALRRAEQERVRIAREVHDVVAHAMVAINVQAGVAAHLADRDPRQARDALLEIKRVSGTALGDLRATLGVLRDEGEAAPVRPTSGLHDLDDLAVGLRAAGVQVTLDVDLAGGTALAATVDATGFRIVQEALTNVLRHAQAGAARVHVRRSGDAVLIDVDDDGGPPTTAASPPAEGAGHGLRGMRERAAAVGGVVDAGPRPDGGWSVRARLPVVPSRAVPSR